MQPPQEISCPYLDVNFMGLVPTKDPWLGIVEQREEKTYLRFHRVNSPNFECASTIEKPNLTAFLANPEGDELITVTHSELTIYSAKSLNVFCSFQVPESGHLSALSPELFLFIGELGSQMIVFGKKHYKNYGSFVLENEVCMRVSAHGRLSDGGYLVGVIDQGHTVEFVSLYEENWRSVKSIFSNTFIFSIEDTETPNECVAVVRMSDNIHQVGVLSKKAPAKLEKETQLRQPILGLFATNRGNAILLSTVDTNTVFTFNTEEMGFEMSFEFLPGVVVAVLEEFVVMEKGLYRMDLSANTINQVLAEQSIIVSATWDGKFIGFQCKDGSYKFFNTQTGEIDRIRKNCHSEYIHRFHCPETLLAASFDEMGHLKVIPLFKESTQVQLHCTDIVTDLLSVGELFVVTFANGKLFVYEFATMTVIHQMQCAAEPLSLLQMGANVLAFATNDFYELQISNMTQTVKVQQIELDPSKECQELVFLHSHGKLLAAHGDCLSLYSVPQQKDRSQSSSFRVVHMNIGVNGDTNPPFATVSQHTLYVAYCYEIVMRNLNTAELLRKQSHGLKEIVGVEKLRSALLVCGLDDMDNTQIFLFSYVDLRILFNESLGKRRVSAIRKLRDDTFFVRDEEKLVTLFELRDTFVLREVMASKTTLCGYTLSVQPKLQMLLMSDPLRYLAVFDFRLGKLVALCRHHHVNTIVDTQFLGSSVVLGDAVGVIAIEEFNFDQGEIARGTLTEVASIRVGAEIVQVVQSHRGVLYSTLSGSVGRLVTVPPNEFALLKAAEKMAMETAVQKQNDMQYDLWVGRPTLDDKLIDGFLIDLFLESSTYDPNYEQVKEVWRKLTNPCF